MTREIFDCPNCKNQFAANLDRDGEYFLPCPYCGREHHRIKIDSDFYDKWHQDKFLQFAQFPLDRIITQTEKVS